MKDLILKYALANAVKFKGRANPGAVIGAIFAHDHKLKAKAKELGKEVADIVKEVNAMHRDDQKKKLAELGGVKEKKKVHREGLKPLPNLGKKLVMRFEPSPSGPLHIGHAYVGSLNSTYCKEHKGKLIIRVADTNADNIYPPAYEQIKEDSEWLWGKIDYQIQSDRMKIYYEYVDKFLKKEAIYVCTCEAEAFRKLINDKKACPCRGLDVKENTKRWKKMLDGTFKQGDAVVRFKSSVTHKNPAMRDFPLLRINESKHPRQGTKYKVWPLMNFSVMVDDLTMGVTHSIRGKDHADNEKRQRMMFDALGEKAPESLFVGRINFDGFEVSCSKTVKKIEEKKYTGWDDVRIPFIPALKRRGYEPSVFVKYAVDVGVSLNDKTVPIKEFFKKLNFFNKEIIDSKSKRFFFVRDAKKIKIKHCLDSVNVPNHPENDLGKRNVKLGEEFYVCDKIENGVYRFMHMFNFENGTFISQDHDAALGAKIIQAVPVDGALDVEVLMDDGKVLKGKGEKALTTLKVGSVIQFERMFFCRFEKKGKTLRFVYLHG